MVNKQFGAVNVDVCKEMEKSTHGFHFVDFDLLWTGSSPARISGWGTLPDPWTFFPVQFQAREIQGFFPETTP